MTARVSPSERIRAQIDELVAGAVRGSLAEHFEQVACLAVRLVLQTALETELTEFLAGTATPVVNGTGMASAMATRR